MPTNIEKKIVVTCISIMQNEVLLTMWAYLFPAFSFSTQFLKPTLWNYVIKNTMYVTVCVHHVNPHIHTCSNSCGFLIALSWSFQIGRCYREGSGTLLQYSCLENPMDGGAW